MPTVCLGHSRMSREGREWRGWEDFFSLGKEMKCEGKKRGWGLYRGIGEGERVS